MVNVPYTYKSNQKGNEEIKMANYDTEQSYTPNNSGMKQFFTILGFELKNYFTNKVFIGITIFLIAAIVIVTFLPRFTGSFGGKAEDTKAPVTFEEPASKETQADGEQPDDGGLPVDADAPVLLVYCNANKKDIDQDLIRHNFAAAFPNYQVKITDSSTADMKQQITDGTAACAFAIDSLTEYTYYVDNLSMYDQNTAIADELLQNIKTMAAMVKNGIPAQEASEILTTPVLHETVSLGKDQIQNFFYTYIMIFALYMVILLYGQMIATNVATEKSSRAMELLITSAKPVSMMFGKVIASCLAGLIQLIAIFGTGLLCFTLNKSYWDGNQIISSIFDIPLGLLGYMLVFFILGFFIYAFMYGAIGSTASKVEDINTSVMPVTILFVVGFFVTMMALANGTVDSLLMKICSYIPFTSPMAMFTRLAMSTVETYEIIISIVLLIVSAVGIGVLAAKVYRVGVLLYGTKPKLGAVLKAVKNT